ncbi:MAG: cytochrome c biogenesis protein CcsA [Polyangiales bacterium]
MHDLLFLAAAILYGAASVALLAHLARGGEGVSARLGPRLLGLAAALHLSHDVLRWYGGAGPFGGLREGLSTLALLVVGGFFAVHRSAQRTGGVGAFVAPLALLALLASRAAVDRTAGSGGALLAMHVGSVLVATAAFAVAGAMALGYLLQERELKRKRLGGLFRRLPSLEVLDQYSYRCVALGLPALTLGIVAGLFVSARATSGAGAWQQYVALGVWAIFAGVLLLQVVAGWRRSTPGPSAPCSAAAAAVLVLAGYFLRGAV